MINTCGQRGIRGRTMGRKIKIILGVVVVIGLGVGIYELDKFLDAIHVSLPEYQATKKTVWLDQNANNDKKDLAWFYHPDQGTRTFGSPLEWFQARQQQTL